jgi:hypothetical protein
VQGIHTCFLLSFPAQDTSVRSYTDILHGTDAAASDHPSAIEFELRGSLLLRLRNVFLGAGEHPGRNMR